MSRFVEQIKADLATVNVRLNGLAQGMTDLDQRGRKMSERRNALIIELQEAEDA